MGIYVVDSIQNEWQIDCQSSISLAVYVFVLTGEVFNIGSLTVSSPAKGSVFNVRWRREQCFNRGSEEPKGSGSVIQGFRRI